MGWKDLFGESFLLAPLFGSSSCRFPRPVFPYSNERENCDRLELDHGSLSSDNNLRVFFPGGLFQIGAGPDELLRAVPQDLRGRPSAEDLQGLPEALRGPRTNRRVHGSLSHH